ncbi:MAG: isoleucine--tRNA ligase [Alphaproteobacteria bacterium]|nr:isoleucine--tRNA ligase [Alphaproteobacteria bacterium]MBV8548585.1 isoleucine--tRNA ligase [Alphaproteobacteria bacterium]
MSDKPTADYRETVFLPKTDFPMRGNLPQQEPEWINYWHRIGLYNRLRAQSKGRPKFILHDGPPYANGNIHIGHSLNKILKDITVRTQQMQGKDAPYVPGWDCHGLPIEWKIEERYRTKGQNKDEVPVLQFRDECRAFADEWKNIQSTQFQRLGVIGDWAHPYATMTKRAEAQILREIYKFVDNGLLYKGVKPVMWSVVEKTALAEAEIEYHDHKSTTLWVAFPVVNTKAAALTGANIVIWTTTPWTIPANRAIAYGDFDYAVLECRDSGTAFDGQKYVVAAALRSQFEQMVLKDGKGQMSLVAEIKGTDFAGTVCRHPWRGGAAYQTYYDYDVPMYFGEFVTTEAGTGFVHIAPGHGEDDFNLGQQYKIKFDETVGDDGIYLPNVKGFAGLAVYKPDGKVGEANGAVMKALSEVGALLAKQNITHSYPHSWRSKAPLIFRTTPQWFIALDQPIAGRKETLREVALQSIGETRWVPGVGENRIRGMIETRPDWCISRQRAWGVPIALFLNKTTGEILKDPAVLKRVADSFEKEGADAWYSHPPSDFLGSAYKTEDYTQVFDIVDVWFESGSTHAFCIDQNESASEWPDQQWPADLYLEGSDQHRGWFHSSLLEACGTRGRAPYNAVLTHGFTLDEQGRKQSKSLGNVVEPQEIYNKLGADILRLWVVSSDFVQDQRVGPEILKQIGDLYRRFRNTLRYLLGALDGFTAAEALPDQQLPELERWVLHRLHEVDGAVREAIAAFDYNRLLTILHDFCNADLSAFYLDIRKDSLYCDATDSERRRAARTAMHHVFEHVVRWLAPILVFTTEEAWQARLGVSGEAMTDSIHLHDFLPVPAQWQNDALAAKWQQLRDLRRVVTGAIEVERNTKKIGSSLQAHPVLYLTDEQNKLLSGIDFAELCIASSLTLTVGAVPANAFTLPDVTGVGVVVELAKGDKCERCWQVLPEVGHHADHPGLCHRCHDVVTKPGKVAA